MSGASKRSVRPALLRQINERAVFEILLRDESASRAQLMRQLNSTAPTIQKAVARLQSAGLVEEVGIEASSRVGRPGMIYRLASERVQVIGVALDVRRTAVVASGLKGTFAPGAVRWFDTPDTYDTLLEALEREIRALLKKRVRTLCIGISTPGEVDVAAQRILLSPNLHITDGQSVSADLHKRLKIDAVMYHETTGTCLAEWAGGAAVGFEDFVMIGVYEGFGASIVANGRLVGGRRGLGGELGHVTIDPDGERCGCGNRGCIETLATDQVFARRVSARVGRTLPIETIVARAASGALDVRQELDDTLASLAVGVAAAINIFNPEAVLICSRMFDADPEAFGRFRTTVEARALKPQFADCRLVRAEGNTLRGATAAAIHHLSHQIGPTF